jgi:hypothetical protein
MNCLLVIGSLCLANVQSVEVTEPSSTSRWATAKVDAADVVIQLSGDSLRGEYDTRRLNRECIADSCVAYHRWCETVKQGWTCYYSTNEVADYSRWLQVTAPDKATFVKAEKSLGIIAGTGAVVVPLSALNIISSDPTPPFCRRGGRDPQCPQ